MARRPMDDNTRRRLAELRKLRKGLKQLGEEPVPYSGWSKNVGFSTPGDWGDEDEVFSPAAETLAIDESPTALGYEESPETEPAPEEPEFPPLPDPSDIIRVGQSNTGSMSTTRPDRYERYGYYGSNTSEETPTSTRVQGMQWIPRGYQRGKGGESLLLGDILVAFARKSMRNPRELIYVFSNVTEGTWEEFQSATSLGRKVKALGGGIPLDGVSKALYLVLHGEESGKDPWEDWIWEYPEFSDTRADNERIK